MCALNKNTILKSKYRTNVLYDFSLVSKAVFYIFEAETGKPPTISLNESFRFPFTFNLVKALPVQINPSDLRMRYGGNISHSEEDSNGNLFGNIELGGSMSPYPIRKKSSESAGNESISISLHYDVYDEYMLSSGEGIGDSGQGTLSLLSSNATSLKELCEYSGMTDKYVLFKWGDIEYFGIMDSIDVTYNTFSRWGVPLKASADIEILKQILATNSQDKEISPTDSGRLLTHGAIKAYQSTRDNLMRAQMIASQALR